MSCSAVPWRALMCHAVRGAVLWMLCGVNIRSVPYHRRYCCTYTRHCYIRVESQKHAFTAQLSPAIAQQRSTASTAPCGAVRCRALPCGAVPRCAVLYFNMQQYHVIPGAERYVCMYIRVYSFFFSLSFVCPLSVLAQSSFPPP